MLTIHDRTTDLAKRPDSDDVPAERNRYRVVDQVIEVSQEFTHLTLTINGHHDLHFVVLCGLAVVLLAGARRFVWFCIGKSTQNDESCRRLPFPTRVRLPQWRGLCARVRA